MNYAQRTGRVFKRAFFNWYADGAQRLGAALAYYAVFSLAPLLVIATVIAGQYFGQAAVEGRLFGEIEQVAGPGAAGLISKLVAAASEPSSSIIATVLSLLTMLFGASGIFVNLQDSLNTIWGTPAGTGGSWGTFLRDRLRSFAMVVGAGFMLLAFLLADTVLTIVSRYSNQLLNLPPFVPSAASKVVSLAALAALFALIFKVLPNARLRWREVWVGGAVTALLFFCSVRP